MQIDYTSRDFAALKADLIALIKERTGTLWDPTDYSDLGNVMVESFAYMGDVMSHYLDRVANEVSIDTAIKTDTLLSFATLFDYVPSGPTPAEVYVTFTNVSASSISIPVGTQVMAPLSYGPFYQVYFETKESATALAAGASITLLCEEGKTVNTDRPDLIDKTYNRPLPASVGTSTGEKNQNFLILDKNVISGSITAYVGQGVAFSAWTYKDNLFEWGPTDNVFTTKLNADGTLYLVFGDGVNGAIPTSGQLVSVKYKTSAGLSGNVKALAVKELTFIPGNIDAEAITYLTVSNPAAAYGGANGDGLNQLRSKTKAAINTRRRAVTLDDHEKLALLVPQVGKVKAVSSVYSSVTMYVQSQNDNSATPGLVSTVAAVSGVTDAGGVVTYTTSAAHGFYEGQSVTITGVNPSAYNLSGVAIASVPTSTTFTVINAATGSFVSGGTATSLTPTTTWNTVKTNIDSYMTDKIMVGTTLTVQPPVYVPVYLALNVTAKAAYKQSDIRLAVYQAFLGTNGLFAYDNNVFGDTITLSSVISAAQVLPGITDVSVTKLNTTNASSAATISLADNQVPYLSADNLTITVTGGIV